MPPDVSGFDSDVIDATIEGKKLSLTPKTYLNLCDADNMVVVVDNAAGSPVFHYNNGMNYDGADHHESYSWESKGYLTKGIESTITTWIIDIKKIREAEGHFHLNAITTPWQGNTQVNSIKIDKYVDPIKSETERLAAGDDQQGWTGLNTLTFNGGSPDYVDLGSYNVLKYVIYTQDPDNSSKAISTTARSIFNTGSSPEIKLAEDSPYLYVNDLSSTFNLKIYYVNLKAIKRTYGTVYLNAIKEVWNSEGNKIMLYEMPCVK